MSSILPIPTGRTSDYLSRTRLVQQIQSDQTDLLRLQNQLSTGQRIFSPSDDPGAALRAITLQRTLERKDQLQINVGLADSRLAAADSSMTEVSNILNEVRAETLGVVGTITTDEERQTAIIQINEVIESLVAFGNSQYQDSYLFGGSNALTSPYVMTDNYVEYRGNETNLQAHVDVGQLFDTNIAGDEVFGGLSEPVRGTADLNLQVSDGTYLSQLNGGVGIGANGAIELSIGLDKFVIDLSGAHTLGDVARMIEEGAPQGSGIRVDVSGGGLTIHPDSDALAILNVSGGRTAQELGILQEAPTLSSFGDDLDPVLRKTSRLSDLVGTKATGRVELGGLNAGVKITAAENGTTYNDLTINLVAGATPGAESLSYSTGPPPELTVTFAENSTKAEDVVDLINNDPSVPLEATVDHYGASPAGSGGQGFVTQQTIGNATAGGVGASLDLDTGLRITNGAGEVAIDTSGAETIEDLLNILNQPEYGLLADINQAGDGIDVRSRRSGANFTIGENGGTLAQDLGLRTFTGDSRIEDFNRGVGVATDDSYTLTLDHDDGSGGVTTYRVNLSDDAVGDFAALAAPPTGSIDLNGSYAGGAGNNLRILFQEDALATSHTASLSGNDLTITVGTSGAGAAMDLDAILSSITDEDFTNSVLYSSGDLDGDYTVGTDAGSAITFSGGGNALTVNDVNDRINAATGGAVTASVATVGNGFELSIDNSSGQTLRAHGQVAQRMGFFEPDADSAEAYDSGGVLSSEDRNTEEVESVFNTLLRLRTALENNDTVAIGEAHAVLEDDLDRATFARSEVGVRLQSLETLQTRLQDEEVQLRSTLSEAIDADLAEVISDFTARQFALQASLQTSANLLQMSILNFI